VKTDTIEHIESLLNEQHSFAPPNNLEVAVAILACARISAPLSVIFSVLSSQALGERIRNYPFIYQTLRLFSGVGPLTDIIIKGSRDIQYGHWINF